MEKLIEGIIKFRQDRFETHRELFSSLKVGQKPHTLFISCSDSRIDPNLITGTLPGELFIIRNIANIVPDYSDADKASSTTSAIEYAVLELGVENIIVCGHSNCGGCAAALKPPEQLAGLPHTIKWLELAREVAENVKLLVPSDQPEMREWIMEQVNIIEQLKNLMTYPFIEEKVKQKILKISGWYYIIETGEVFILNDEQRKFYLANE